MSVAEVVIVNAEAYSQRGIILKDTIIKLKKSKLKFSL